MTTEEAKNLLLQAIQRITRLCRSDRDEAECLYEIEQVCAQIMNAVLTPKSKQKV